jgi:hypothetical protein
MPANDRVVDDMTNLRFLHEPAILHNIKVFWSCCWVRVRVRVRVRVGVRVRVRVRMRVRVSRVIRLGLRVKD